MGRPSARFGGLIPSDSLTDSVKPKPPQVPTRYTAERKDPKVVHDLNNRSGEAFLMPEMLSHNPKSPSSITSKRILNNNDGGITAQVQAGRAKRQRNGNRLTHSGPTLLDIDEVPEGYECNNQGTFRVLHDSGKETLKTCAVLGFNAEGIGMCVRRGGYIIEGSFVEFLEECKTVYFSRQDMHLGVVLKHSRIFNVGNSDKASIFLWTESKENGTTLTHIREKLQHSLVNTVIIDENCAKDDYILHAMNSELKKHRIKFKEPTEFIKGSFKMNEEKPNQRSEPRFFQDKLFQSLSKNSKPHASGSAITIDIPREPSSPPGQSISTDRFYTQPSQNSLINHTLSSVQRVTRSNTLKNSTNSSSDESDIKYETPATFKPSLFYKFGDKTTLSITNQDFKCLYNHDWINDSILDFFIKYWIECSAAKDIISFDQVHVMSSFFYTKLVSNAENYYTNVKKWVRDTDLFNKDYVVMPINESFHWYGCIISNLPALLAFLIREHNFRLKHQGDIENGENENSDDISVTSPIVSIMVYDSLRQTHSREVEPIKEFLIAYAADKYNLEVSRNQMKMKTCVVPQQPNMSDCGVHVILNTRTFFDNPKKTIDLWRESKLKNKSDSRTINEYFDRKGRVNARSDLRSILWDLQRNQIEFNRSNGITEDSDSGIPKSDDEGHSDIEILEDYAGQNHLEENDQKENELEKPDLGKNSMPIVTGETSTSSPGEKKIAVNVGSHSLVTDATLKAHTKAMGSSRSRTASLSDASEGQLDKPEKKLCPRVLESSPDAPSYITGDMSSKSPYFPVKSVQSDGQLSQDLQHSSKEGLRAKERKTESVRRDSTEILKNDVQNQENKLNNESDKAVYKPCSPTSSLFDPLQVDIKEKRRNTAMGDDEPLIGSPHVDTDDDVRLIRTKSRPGYAKETEIFNIPPHSKIASSTSDNGSIDCEEVHDCDVTSVRPNTSMSGGLSISSPKGPVHKFRNGINR
ncbi:LANO_0F10528g1_1 [Lachancea nothofagi CBS 11611]|uniref:LANO_0F10528g1_1 n=1 Tax=Lachancea nothofagi CBS 11611 TaxID=1266666 RepID=A0A1G4KAD9_9SACH|nr:LANO_0F10528g1_1 [Lachancea nothofagi CBS 11611]